MKKLSYAFFVSTLCLLASCSSAPARIDLAGAWTICLDSTDTGLERGFQGTLFDDRIALPGTTDAGGYGTPCTLRPALEKPQLLHLTRAHSYIGAAWYAREIAVPASWRDKRLFLHLERVIWDTQVWIDGRPVEGHEQSLSTPHRYDLTTHLVAGQKHLLTIRVDNRKRYDISVKELAHAYTEDTQVKWNGILGDIGIEAADRVRIDDLQIHPDAARRSVRAVIALSNDSEEPHRASVELEIIGKEDGAAKGHARLDVDVPCGGSTVDVVCELDPTTRLWNEFDPYLLLAEARLTAPEHNDIKQTVFGLREIRSAGNRLEINGRPLFLRGTLECCIFPLTGTPPTDEEGWLTVFRAAREYGLNHLRFHSWCPPEAAFAVADRLGFYLQVELPVWTLTMGRDEQALAFLRDEARRIARCYGNHPSFCLWSLGNELEGDFDAMATLLREMKEADPRHLYTTTSFTFASGHGVGPEPDDDFFVTQWTDNGWVRGQGVFNQEPPSFDKDFRTAIEGTQVPLVTHEVGQYSVYPDLREIERYTGTLLPLNFRAVEDDLERKGLLHKAPDYLKASGKLAAILYKEELERAMKTPGISGIQLLDLHDFPGQGTALVGLLNAFWQSKGIIEGERFREFCSPVVPLLRFPKAVYTVDETFEAQIELCNYGAGDLVQRRFVWEIRSGDEVFDRGTIDAPRLAIGHNDAIGRIRMPLHGLSQRDGVKLEVVLALEDSPYRNRWNIWVYPTAVDPVWGEVEYTRDYDRARALLAAGRKVLFNPDWRRLKGIEGKFVPVFWSPVHFPNQAGTMGILCDPAHPALAAFPTDMHTDWQWWDLCINSTTLVTDSLQGGTPIVEQVDNFVNNRRLASLYEGAVGDGKLMLATFDLHDDLPKRPVARQMLASLLSYMNSPAFAPKTLTGFDDMRQRFGTADNRKQGAEGIY